VVRRSGIPTPSNHFKEVSKTNKPVKLSVNSQGARYLKFQEVLWSKKYLFYPVSGNVKTKVFTSGVLGNGKCIKLYHDIWDALHNMNSIGYPWVLAVPHGKIRYQLTKKLEFVGRLPLKRAYILNVNEVVNFVNAYCMECEFYGVCGREKGYMQLECNTVFKDRDKFIDGCWMEIRKEQKRKRKQKKQQIKQQAGIA
jgi:hypothetical protein